MDRFEHHRTHWAVKDGDIPAEVLAKAQSSPPDRNIPQVYKEFREAQQAHQEPRAKALRTEIISFPHSIEKGIEYLRTGMTKTVCLEAYPLLAHEHKAAQIRQTVERVLANEQTVLAPHPDMTEGAKPFSLASFYKEYGSPTELAQLEENLAKCESVIAQLDSEFRSNGTGMEFIAFALWRCGQSPVLSERLGRQLKLLMDQIMQNYSSEGFMNSASDKINICITSWTTVGI